MAQAKKRPLRVTIATAGQAARQGAPATSHVLDFIQGKMNTAKDGTVTSTVYHELVEGPNGPRPYRTLQETGSGNFYLRRELLDELGWEDGPDGVRITIEPLEIDVK